MELTCVTIDCADAERVATFWSAALGWVDPTVAPDGSGAVCRNVVLRDPEGNEFCLGGGVFPG